MRADVIVLGAGIVGVGVALHLQKRGRDVVLIDRRGAGEETSYGNAGLIQREAVIPYTFPREFGAILSYAMNRRRDAVYHLSALPRIAPWLYRYWQNAAPECIERSARALAPLMAHCVAEHDALIAEAGDAAVALIQRKGWIRCLRTEESLRQAVADARRLDKYGVDYAILSGAQLRELEPHVSEKITGAIHFRGSPSSSDPGMLTKAYADLFVRKGGRFLVGDARGLTQETSGEASGWSLPSESGPITAREAVVALGPWSDDVFRPLGYDIPLAVKRGYHMHYRISGNATLGHPLQDRDGGYSLAPMRQGIRLTTGVEFADRDMAPNPVQLGRDEPLARELFPLGERLEPAPWLGRRPCLPDMVPVIGRGARHPGLWFAFGHAHHGFTLGPVTGRLLAEMMTGETPFTDPAVYAVDRFRN
jgi:D-amino-acid dehydrogenase